MTDYVELLAGELIGGDADGFIPASVQNLVSEHGTDGAAATWAYLAEGSMSADEAIEHTMKRFKGHFADIGAFAEDFFSSKLDDVAAGEVNHPLNLVEEWSAYVDWDDLAEDLIGGNAPKFEVVEVDSGVYVWDISDL